MFSELPKPFDRNFVIAYFLPVSIFIVSSAWLMGYWQKVQAVLTGNTSLDVALLAFDATLVVFAAWVAGILLLVLNREIYRLLEGYWKYNPLLVLENKVKKDFKSKIERLNWLDEQYSKPGFTDKLQNERTKIMVELAKNYPDQEKFLLPTSFGNALRAFETYPRVMYGMEGIDGWPRMLAVIPRDYRDLIDDAKAQVDWWVNLGVMSVFFLFEFWVVIFSKWGLSAGWIYTILNIFVPLSCCIILNLFFLWRATNAAIGWGDYVKSAFDIYRFALLEALDLEVPQTIRAEEEMWTKFSQAIVFRLPDRLQGLKKLPLKHQQKSNPN